MAYQQQVKRYRHGDFGEPAYFNSMQMATGISLSLFCGPPSSFGVAAQSSHCTARFARLSADRGLG